MIRDARLPDEAAALIALQRRASDVWEEYREQLAAHPDAIALPDDANIRVAVAADGELAGFSAVIDAHELDGLFVEPAAMGAGIGRALVADAAARARAAGSDRLDVIANPRAAGFYERAGFVRREEVPTRFGPALRMILSL